MNIFVSRADLTSGQKDRILLKFELPVSPLQIQLDGKAKQEEKNEMVITLLQTVSPFSVLCPEKSFSRQGQTVAVLQHLPPLREGQEGKEKRKRKKKWISYYVLQSTGSPFPGGLARDKMGSLGAFAA